MTDANFVNRCDRVGGLYQGFSIGLGPQDLDEDSVLLDCVTAAFNAWKDFSMAENEYFNICEKGDF